MGQDAIKLVEIKLGQVWEQDTIHRNGICTTTRVGDKFIIITEPICHPTFQTHDMWVYHMLTTNGTVIHRLRVWIIEHCKLLNS